MSKLNLIGKRFGKLLVVSETTAPNTDNPYNHRYWQCVCECDNVLIKRTSALTAGDTIACKTCSDKFRQSQQKRASDLTGQTIGNLTALYRLEASTKYKWKCNLCGSETLEQEGTYIKNGNTKSCGCLKKNLSTRAKEAYKLKRNDLTNKKFGYLTVIKYHSFDDISHSTKWECLCDCGNIKLGKTSHLVLGEVSSCGCKTSYMLSKAKGGTGIPYETVSISEFIRKHTQEYKTWRLACMKRDLYTCQISKKRGGNLIVHHLSGLNIIIEQNKITKENYKNFSSVLFDISNGITITENNHLLFHTIFGNGYNTKEQFLTFTGFTND